MSNQRLLRDIKKLIDSKQNLTELAELYTTYERQVQALRKEEEQLVGEISSMRTELEQLMIRTKNIQAESDQMQNERSRFFDRQRNEVEAIRKENHALMVILDKKKTELASAQRNIELQLQAIASKHAELKKREENCIAVEAQNQDLNKALHAKKDELDQALRDLITEQGKVEGIMEALDDRDVEIKAKELKIEELKAAAEEIYADANIRMLRVEEQEKKVIEREAENNKADVELRKAQTQLKKDLEALERKDKEVEYKTLRLREYLQEKKIDEKVLES